MKKSIGIKIKKIIFQNNSTMEHAQLQTSDGAQVMTINGQQLQVLQMSNTPHMLQGPNGQQIVVHTIPSSAPTLQVGYSLKYHI